jgi:hypothetical protein
MLQVSDQRRDNAQLQRVKSLMASLPPPKSMAQVEREASNGGRGNPDDGGNEPVSVGEIGEPVPMPSTSYRPVKGGNVFQASVPTNWYSVSSQSSIKFVPQNGYGQLNGQAVFTHGAEVGVMRAQSRDLADATDAVLESLASSNPELRDIDPPRGRACRSARRSATAPERQPPATGAVGLAVSGRWQPVHYVTVVPAREANLCRPSRDCRVDPSDGSLTRATATASVGAGNQAAGEMTARIPRSRLKNQAMPMPSAAPSPTSAPASHHVDDEQEHQDHRPHEQELHRMKRLGHGLAPPPARSYERLT